MKAYHSVEAFPFDGNSLVTLGTFDGVHLGHRKIIETLITKAAKRDARTVLVTYHPHPKIVIQHRDEVLHLLTTIEEKMELLANCELDHLLIMPFTEAFSMLEPTEFIESILLNGVGVRELVIGYDHTFGRKQKGDRKLLEILSRRYGFDLEVVEPVTIEGEWVSSTRIRQLLLEGRVDLARRLLGRPYRLTGVVERGDQVGVKLGFPTANLQLPHPCKLVPCDGVYAVVVHLEDGRYPGMANIGYRPTVRGSERKIEIHIHNYSGDLYGKSLQVEFIEHMRDERHFDSLDALVTQIEEDRKQSVELLSKTFRR